MLLFLSAFRGDKINNKYQITKTLYEDLNGYLKKSRKFSLPTFNIYQVFTCLIRHHRSSLLRVCSKVLHTLLYFPRSCSRTLFVQNQQESSDQ